MTEITQHPHRLRVADVEIVDETALLLLEALAGFELAGGGVGRLRIGGVLRLRDAQGVHGVGPLDEVGNQGQVARIVERIAHFAVEGVVLRTAVLAKAVDGEMREVDVVGQRALGPGEISAGAESAEAPIDHAGA